MPKTLGGVAENYYLCTQKRAYLLTLGKLL